MEVLISAPPTGAANYIAALSAAGGQGRAEYCPRYDPAYGGLILAGGGDVSPALYGGSAEGCAPPDIHRDRAELALLDAFSAAGKPVLGICRGAQVINVWAGGTLFGDLGAGNAVHRWAGADRVHELRTAPGSLLRGLYGPRLWANSAHHQAVRRAGRGLAVTAWSADGVIEALEHTRLPILAVQFHPERMRSAMGWPGAADGTALFRTLLSAERQPNPDGTYAHRKSGQEL